jgi:hypothetical protein
MRRGKTSIRRCWPSANSLNLVTNGELEAGGDFPAGWHLQGNDSRVAMSWQVGGAFSGRRAFRLADRGPFVDAFGARHDPDI